MKIYGKMKTRVESCNLILNEGQRVLLTRPTDTKGDPMTHVWYAVPADGSWEPNNRLLIHVPDVDEVPNRLRSIGQYVANICLGDPGTFTIHLAEDFRVVVRIVKSRLGEHVWDQVYLNDEHCGNRHGGVERLLELAEEAGYEIP